MIVPKPVGLTAFDTTVTRIPRLHIDGLILFVIKFFEIGDKKMWRLFFFRSPFTIFVNYYRLHKCAS